MNYKLLAILLLAFGTGSAAWADAPLTGGHWRSNNSFDGHIVFCAPPSDPTSVEVLPDGTQIITFVNVGNLWFTGNPLIDGVEENHVTATFSPTSPTGRLDITGTVDVTAVDGGWRFRQLIFTSPDGDTGYGIAFGTGDLRGRVALFRSAAPEEIDDSPCFVPFGAPINGRIIRFGWRT